MNRHAWKAGIIALAATVTLAGGCSSGSPSPSEAASSGEQTTVTLAAGSFTADLGSWGETFDIEATGTGDDVFGTMEVTHPAEGTYSVDLQCSRTADDGLLVIGGEVTESTHETFSEGAYVAILLAPGTPVRTLLWLEDDASTADSCPAYLENMFSAPEFLELTADDLIPVEGDLQLGP
jgi:hypothetical protein